MFGAALATPWTWILLGFRCFATTPYEPFLGTCSAYLALLLRVSKVSFGQHVWSRIGHPLDLNPAGVPLFRNHAPRSLFRKLLCVFCFALGVSRVPFGQHVWSRIGHPLDLNPAGVPLSRNHAPRSLFRNLLCVFCFAFRGFEGAVWAACLEPHWPPLGLESCWGSAVSQPRPTNPF